VTERLTISQLAAYADPEMDQHFLINQDKLARIVAAAEVEATDRILEIGAGLGTVARELPRAKSLTLVELDSRLIEPLRAAVPWAHVVNGNALEILGTFDFDVLISNLPHSVTVAVMAMLPSLTFRTALVTMGETADITGLIEAGFRSELVARIGGDDFSPPQESFAQVVKFSRATK
jgi:16S rRNA A1518/A1519 N6-dimethyltransferase RsmA/KsgA/DIM1 with predicted DNA glycosylase/AP lyase activity